MKIFMKYDVLEAAKWRIKHIFDNFEEIVISFSGGKDSTAVLNLALMEAEERGRLPLKVFFLDQEAEWAANIEYVKSVMYDPRIEPYWMQIPFRISNASNMDEGLENHWLWCWEEGKDETWMRPKDPIAKTENIYDTPSFHELFHRFPEVHWPDKSVAFLAGVRAEESPTRAMTLTTSPKWGHITYGKRLRGKYGDEPAHITFYPVYDWSYTDIWKFIYDYDLPYCTIYDKMYQLGYAKQHMRISSLNHEISVLNIWKLQEIEHETWVKLTKRLKGMNTLKHLERASLYPPDELPEAFDSWIEYRDYLIEHLVPNDTKHIFRKKFAEMDALYSHGYGLHRIWKAQIQSVLANDYHMVKVGNWERRPSSNAYRKWLKKGIAPNRHNVYIDGGRNDKYYDFRKTAK